MPKVSLSLIDIFQIFLILLVLGFLSVRYTYSELAVRFITFNTNLNMLKVSSPPKSSNFVLWILLVGMLCTENPIESNIALAYHLFHDATLYPSWATLKVGISIFPYVIYIILSLIAITPVSHLVLLVAIFAMRVRLTAVPPGSLCS